MHKRQQQIEILNTLNNYLGNLINGIEEMVNNFYEGREAAALEKMPLVCDGLQWCLRVIENTKELTGLNKEETILSEHLVEIVEALENQDYILIADLFNYEIKESLVRIRECTNKIIEG